MPIEFDPTTSTYYATSYTGNVSPSQPTEPPPLPPEEAAEAASPTPSEAICDEPPSSEEGTQVGSVVDEVV